MSDLKTPRPNKGPNLGLTSGIVLLLLALMGGSLFLILRTVADRTGNSGRGTPSPAKEEMTPTPTRTPTPTATPFGALFTDNFVNNTNSWDVSSTSGYIRSLGKKMLTLADTKPGTTLTESVPTNDTFDDFTVTVTFALVQADKSDSAGIYVRGDSNLDHDYRIEINGDNSYDIAKEYLDSNNKPQSIVLAGPSTTSSLKPLGQQNTFKVIMKGPSLVLLINDNLTNSLTDVDYIKGQIAFFAHHGSSSNGVKATFCAIEVNPPPAQLPD